MHEVCSMCVYCLMHGKLPQTCMLIVIVPICKNDNGSISDDGRYRHVSFAAIVSKLFEHHILSCISPFVDTTDNHFCFMPQPGTD